MTLAGYVSASDAPPIWTTGTILGAKFRTFAPTAAVPASAAWPTANKAILIPFYVAAPTTFQELFFVAGTSPGTTAYDLGVYSENFDRIVSLGATSAVNTTDTILPSGGGPFNPTTLGRGRYYLAMSSAATTLTTRANTYGNGILRAIGCKQMAAAHPLPATITPAAHVDNYIPLMGLSTVYNVL